MMNERTNHLEFEVLGHKVKLKAEESGEQAKETAEKAISMIQEEADSILSHSPHLETEKVAVLIALKVTCRLLNVEGEFRHSIETLHSTVGDALQYIEEATSTTVN